MNKLCALFVALMIVLTSYSQIEVSVTAKGLDRNSAKNNAMRDAVEEAVGAYIKSNSQVENFMLVKDAIVTKSEGYITSSEIINEGNGDDGLYFVELNATVSTEPIEQNIETLQMMIGGLKFIVMYDCRVTENEDLYEFAQSRMNEVLTQSTYQYINKIRFDESCSKTSRFFANSNADNTTAFRQKLGFYADAEFIIFIKNIELQQQTQEMGGVSLNTCSAKIFCEAFDNSTGEGLGDMVFNGTARNPDLKTAKQNAIKSSVFKGLPEILDVFKRYMGNWVNNGAPYELRFYNIPTYGEMLKLKKLITSDADFGNEITIKRDVDKPNKFVMYCSFRKKQDEMLDKVYEKIYEVENLAAKNFDAKIIYGRQLSFAPANYTIVE